MKWVGAVLFGIFVIVAVFGLPVLLSHDGHGMGCPLMSMQAVVCDNTVIEHISIWQAMFAGVTNALMLLAAIALFVVARGGRALVAHERIRFRLANASSARPTLMQELYSRGILNRKEPALFS